VPRGAEDELVEELDGQQGEDGRVAKASAMLHH